MNPVGQIQDLEDMLDLFKIYTYYHFTEIVYRMYSADQGCCYLRL
jgi:hypothetical protein